MRDRVQNLPNGQQDLDGTFRGGVVSHQHEKMTNLVKHDLVLVDVYLRELEILDSQGV